MKPQPKPTEPNLWYGLMQNGPVSVRLLDLKGAELAFEGYKRLKPVRKLRFVGRRCEIDIKYPYNVGPHQLAVYSGEALVHTALANRFVERNERLTITLDYKF